MASLLRVGPGGRHRTAAAARRRRAPELPGEDWFHLRPAALGHLRLGPGHPRRAQLPLLRGHGQLPLRPRPRGGRSARRRWHRPCRPRPRARAPGPSSSRCSAAPPATSDPPCPHCAGGHTGLCGNVAFGDIEPRPADRVLRRHRRRLVHRRPGRPLAPSSTRCPTPSRDEDAVMVEPTACAVHAVLSAGVPKPTPWWPSSAPAPWAWPWWPPSTTWSGRGDRCTVMVGAKHPHQRQLAEKLGADPVVAPRPAGPGGPSPIGIAGAGRAPDRRRRRGLRLRGHVRVADATLWPWSGPAAGSCWWACPAGSRSTWPRCGTASSRWSAPTPTGPRPSPAPPAPVRTFELAIDLVAEAGLGSLVSAAYPLERYEEAIAHAGAAGRRGAVKVVFDLRQPEGKNPMSPRPGFVLDVDRSTPPTLFWRGRALQPRAPARGQPGHLRARTDRPAEGRLGRHPGRARQPGRRPGAAAGAAPPGHEADHRLRRHLPAPAADGTTRHPPAGDRAGPRHGRRRRGGRRRSSSWPWPSTGG